MEKIIQIISEEQNIKKYQVENAIKLIDDGNTIPFIARYRKEATGNLSDEELRNLFDRLNYLRNLNSRKEEVLNSIEKQGKLTNEIKNNIENAMTLSDVEDFYRPFKQKKQTKAQIAKQNGLEELSKIILAQKGEALEKVAKKFVCEKFPDENSCILGALDIIAEDISDNPKYRKMIKKYIIQNGIIEVENKSDDLSNVYSMYNNYSECYRTIPSHRILAINRGEKERVLKVKLEKSKDLFLNKIKFEIIKKDSPYKELLENAIEDSYKRLIEPSVDRELRSELSQKAEDKAIDVFSKNAKSLFLQPPIKNKVIMGFDPAFRTGCKIAVIDETGKFLDYTTIYPTEPQNKVEESKEILKKLIKKYNIELIALGNGTASRESESFIAQLIKEVKTPLNYVIVSEAGASVYSASKLATQEYPDINVSIRGAISIARRLQDPLVELVKIDPKSIGVGQYQHDVNQKKLNESLRGVVEDSVNSVGVDVNTATYSLLEYVSGINKTVAKNIVKYRDENGKLKNRKELLNVPKLGNSAYKQCAGFLRVLDGDNPLDITAVHPESYDISIKLLKSIGFKKEDLKDKEKIIKLRQKLKEINVKNISEELGVGELTLKDIIEELSKPGRDSREQLPKPILRSDVLKFEDLAEGMILKGTVRNIVDFGAFVDIGIKNDGLVHISEISDKFIKSPYDFLSIGDVVDVKVIGLDKAKSQVKLSLKI